MEPIKSQMKNIYMFHTTIVVAVEGKFKVQHIQDYFLVDHDFKQGDKVTIIIEKSDEPKTVN